MTSLRGPVRFDSAEATGAVYDYGAQVVSWRPTGGEEVLWASHSSAYEPGIAIRGGIPICFPWFGSGLSGDRVPSHGFARLTSWTLADVEDDGSTVTATHSLSATNETRRVFPYEFFAVHRATFGRHLDVHLSVQNTGEVPFTFEEALHTYLRVGDSRQVVVRGLDGFEYIDQVDSGLRKTQDGDIRITGETDRVYLSGGGVDVIDPVLRRTLHVRMAQAADTVVWNPWIDRAAALPDFDDDGWQTMVCIEGANVRAHAVALDPGAVHSLGYQVSVTSMDAVAG